MLIGRQYYKKTICRLALLTFVMALCISLALPASATSKMKLVSGYGKFRGDCHQDEENPYILTMSTSVAQNNSGARLRMYVDIWGLGDSIYVDGYESDPGALLLTHDHPLYTTIDFEPERVFVEHYLVASNGDILSELFIEEVLCFPN